MNYFLSTIIKCSFYFLLLVLAKNTMAQEVHKNTERKVNIRAVPVPVNDSLKNLKDFHYANDPSYWPKQTRPDNSGIQKFLIFMSRSGIMKWVLVILLAALVVFVLYQVLSVNGFNLFTARKKKVKLGESLSHEEAENIDQLIAVAIQQQKFREATRYLYLKTLQVLNDHSQIKLQAKATNHDYLLQMAGTPKSREFGKLTNLFEYVWYGEFQPRADQFHTINNQFNRFISQI